MITDILSSAYITAKNDKGEVIEDDNLVRLLKNPNKHQSFKEFSSDFVRNLLCAGYCYVDPRSESKSNVRRLDKIDSSLRPELYVLNTDCIHFGGNEFWSFLGFGGKKEEFIYRIEGLSEERKKYDDIIPFYDSRRSTSNILVGTSRLISVKDEITNIILANRAKTNKIRLSGHTIVSPSSKSLGQGFGGSLQDPVDNLDPSYTQRDLLEEKFDSGGLAQDKAISVIDIEMNSVNLIHDIQNYSFDKDKKEDEREVYNIFNIPRELQNIGDDQPKYENRKQAMIDLTSSVVAPIGQYMVDRIREFYGHENNVALDFSHLPYFDIKNQKETQSKRDTADFYIRLMKENLMTVDAVKSKLKEYEII